MNGRTPGTAQLPEQVSAPSTLPLESGHEVAPVVSMRAIGRHHWSRTVVMNRMRRVLETPRQRRMPPPSGALQPQGRELLKLSESDGGIVADTHGARDERGTRCRR